MLFASLHLALSDHQTSLASLHSSRASSSLSHPRTTDLRCCKMQKSWVAGLLLSSAFCFRTVASTPSFCKSSNTRRLLTEEDSGANGFGAYTNRCGHQNYDLHLIIGIHFSLYAEPTTTPTSEDNNEECKPLLLHADSSGEEGKAKTVFEVERIDEDKSTPSSSFFEYGSLPLGSFAFRDIADAFYEIEVDAVAGDRTYDIVTNNCAVLILGMMKNLGIQLSNDQRQAVVKGLIAADADAQGRLAGYIREGNEIERTLGLTKDATNEELLERLTLRQIERALDTEDGESSAVGVRGAADASSSLAGTRSLVVRGKPVESQLYPYFVEPEFINAKQPCSGVLVAKDIILTTASCYGACVRLEVFVSKLFIGSPAAHRSSLLQYSPST